MGIGQWSFAADVVGVRGVGSRCTTRTRARGLLLRRVSFALIHTVRLWCCFYRKCLAVGDSLFLPAITHLHVDCSSRADAGSCFAAITTAI